MLNTTFDASALTNPLVIEYFEKAPKNTTPRRSYSREGELIDRLIIMIEKRDPYGIALYLEEGIRTREELDKKLDFLDEELADISPAIAAVQAQDMLLLSLFAKLKVNFSKSLKRDGWIPIPAGNKRPFPFYISAKYCTPLFVALLTLNTELVTFVANQIKKEEIPSLIKIYHYVDRLPWHSLKDDVDVQAYKSNLLKFIQALTALPEFERPIRARMREFSRWVRQPPQSLVEEFLMWKKQQALPDSERTPTLLKYLKQCDVEGSQDGIDLRRDSNVCNFMWPQLPVAKDEDCPFAKNPCEFLYASAAYQPDGLLLFFIRAVIHDRVLQVAQALQLGVVLDQTKPELNNLIPAYAPCPNQNTAALLLKLGVAPTQRRGFRDDRSKQQLKHPLVIQYFEKATKNIIPLQNFELLSGDITADLITMIEKRNPYGIALCLDAELSRNKKPGFSATRDNMTPLIMAIQTQDMLLLSLFAELKVPFSSSLAIGEVCIPVEKNVNFYYPISEQYRTPLFIAILTLNDAVVTFIANQMYRIPSLIDMYQYVNGISWDSSGYPSNTSKYKAKLLTFIQELISLPQFEQPVHARIEEFSRKEKETPDFLAGWRAEKHAMFPFAQRQRALTLLGLWKKSNVEYRTAAENNMPYTHEKPYQFLEQLPEKVIYKVTSWMMS